MSTCLRCGRDYDNPYPEETEDGGPNAEIATVEYCARCNAIVMCALYRGASAYYVKGGRPPWQNESLE